MPSSNSQRLSLILDLSPSSARFLDNHSQFMQLQKGSDAIHKGDAIAGAYIVVKGSLRVFSYTPQGQESTLYMINPGETCVFAINCLFQKMLYPAWVRAEEAAQVVYVKGSAYKELFSHDKAIQNLTINALSTAVHRIMEEVEQLQGWSLEQRVVNHLLNRATGENTAVLTQQEIANHLGSTREAIARILSGLSKQGLVTTGRGRITLSEPAALASLLK